MTAATQLGSAKQAAPPPVRPRGRRWLAYALLAPGMLYLFLFFVVPAIQLFITSLYDPSGSDQLGYHLTWHWSTYVDVFNANKDIMLRSLGYALTATAICLLLGFPLAYAIALKAGRWRNILLIMVVAPFFTSFLIRTLAWKIVLSDRAWITTTLDSMGLLPDHRLLATAPAVVTGIAYNFLPFMVLPLYASLEKLDPRLLEAAKDLYAGPVRTFFKVTLPLAAPGVVAGTLLTFIPAAGDYINAELLGGPNTQMVGNQIQRLFTKIQDYPSAAALSFILMAGILIIVFAYLAKAGTDEVV